MPLTFKRVKITSGSGSKEKVALVLAKIRLLISILQSAPHLWAPDEPTHQI